MTEPIHILSLGAGVQSSTMALMAANGEITPMPTAAVFADTQAEPKGVYEWLDYLTPLLPFPVLKVSRGNLAADGLVVHTSKKSGKRYIKSLIPAFTLQPDGSRGLLGRKCTRNYKVDEIIKKVREVVTNDAIKEWRKRHKSACKELSLYFKREKEIKKANKEIPDKKLKLPYPDFPHAAKAECQADALAISWIGISSDEADRMKPSQVIWIRNEWPLIDKLLSRADCLSWMKANGFREPPRSACTFCPFHSDDEWIRLRDESPEEFQKVVEYEKDLQLSASRQEALTGVPYLHDSCVPIGTIKFKPSSKTHKQLEKFSNECEGLCGV